MARKIVPEPKEPNESYESDEQDVEVPVQVSKQSGKGLGKGCYIDRAREKAMIVIQERKALNQKKREAEKMRQQIEKELAEAEYLKTQRDLEEVRRLKEELRCAGAALVARETRDNTPLVKQKQPIAVCDKRKKSHKPTSESESEEEESVQVRQTVKKQTLNSTDLARLAYQERIHNLRQGMLKQMFGE